jgi:hypothetical protein
VHLHEIAQLTHQILELPHGIEHLLTRHGHSTTPGYTAHALADKARTRLFWPSSLEALSDVDLALASIGNVVTADYKVDGRWLSRCTFDVRLNGQAREADLNGRTSYIATVEATATIRSPNGTAIDIDIQPSLSG